MFDPTAYENLKVILEGLVYEYDFNEAILVTSRDDIVNLANLSRSFQMDFCIPTDQKELLEGSISLSANFEQLASEWYPMGEEPGCDLEIQYSFEIGLSEFMEKRVLKLLRDEFSEEYELDWIKQIHSGQKITYHFLLRKIEPVTEDTSEELKKIVEKTVKVLRELYSFIYY